MARYRTPYTTSCALCTSDKVILLQSSKGATICLNELNFIDVNTAFLANVHRRFFLLAVCVLLFASVVVKTFLLGPCSQQTKANSKGDMLLFIHTLPTTKTP